MLLLQNIHDFHCISIWKKTETEKYRAGIQGACLKFIQKKPTVQIFIHSHHRISPHFQCFSVCVVSLWTFYFSHYFFYTSTAVDNKPRKKICACATSTKLEVKSVKIYCIFFDDAPVSHSGGEQKRVSDRILYYFKCAIKSKFSLLFLFHNILSNSVLLRVKKDKNRTFMQRLIDFSPATIKKLCFAQTYGSSSSKMSKMILVLAFIAVLTKHVSSSEYPGECYLKIFHSMLQRRKNFHLEKCRKFSYWKAKANGCCECGRETISHRTIVKLYWSTSKKKVSAATSSETSTANG